MKKIYLLLSALAFGSITAAKAQLNDTITVMHHNLTNYGNFTTYCTSTNNGVSMKDGHIKTITKYVKPDIFTINELGSNVTYANRLLSLVLNTDGVTSYKRAEMTNTTGSSIVNMLFYNDAKLALHSQETITAPYRDINLYRLYYKSPNLATTNDTVFIVCIVAHLKAGNTSADAVDRGIMAQKVIDFLSAKNKAANYMLMGDFNVYTSAEAAYQSFITATNPKARFYDPINQMGAWSNNSAYKAVHTQSTRITSNGCLAGGGMDDRFDHIMLTQHLLNDSAGAKFIQGSYKAIGQDGNRFNGNVNDGTNTSVPATVANALFNASDHLPVSVKLHVTGTVTSLKATQRQQPSIIIQNPMRDNRLVFDFKNRVGERYNLSVLNLIGQTVASKDIVTESNRVETQWNLPKGLYILRVTDERNRASSFRLLVE